MAAMIKPFDEEHGHAISNVLIVFEFSAPLSPHVFTDLRAGGKLHESLKADLPRVVEQQQMTFNFNVGADHQMFAPPISQPGMIGGISFDRIKPNGEAAMSVNVQANALLIICGEYERWAKVSEEVGKYLDILNPLLSPISVSSLLLQYTDIFKVSYEAGQPCPLTDLFSSQSKYLPPSFANISDSFHSHHGFFTTPDFTLNGKLLTNINVNVTEAASVFDVNIVTMHKYMLSDMLPLIAQDSEINKIIKPVFQYLHDQSKLVFGDLLTDAAKRLIKFDSKNPA
ncbi:TIGR04255 family protein [Pseudomonas sp. RTC3]|uniref:TIGR04255 family protein n=1 Tax=Pseudomonas sp. 5C2 TaxID=3048588 RepID=UPI002AB46FF5|nr:TIGR04255 family protein [Pseudomonas sp. 5C2]MDY7567500.1 TIGR04255 family protein [Pseudomonas sp. 5C2]MEB0064562.1 TIGR04255 family protein [Pseudomonas sp. RTC3]MEB0243030.1 TIGR04255 family protein [Pseudomonas sp. 5C2]